MAAEALQARQAMEPNDANEEVKKVAAREQGDAVKQADPLDKITLDSVRPTNLLDLMAQHSMVKCPAFLAHA